MKKSFLLTAVAVFAAVLVMRGPVTAVGSIADTVMQSFSLTYIEFGFLNALPVAAFGLFSFAAQPLTKTLGSLQAVLTAALAAVAAGSLCRTVNAVPLLFISTAAVGAGIALLNVSIPVVIRRAFPQDVNRAMGIFTAFIGLSGAVGAATAAPLASLTTTPVPTFAFWGLLGCLGLILWLMAAPARNAGGQQGRLTEALRLVATPAAWPVILTMGLQSLTIYTVSAWLPTILTETGDFTTATAGTASGLFLLSGFFASLVTKEFLRLCRTLRRAAVILGILFLFGIAGWLAGGFTAWAGCILAGVPQGLMFSVALIFISEKSPNADAMLALSAAAQGTGYLIAGLGPWIFGGLFALAGVTAGAGFLAAAVIVWTGSAVLASGHLAIFPKN